MPEYVIDDFAPKDEWLQLPSQRGTDKAIKVRQPDLVSLISGEGEIPDLLSGVVTAMLNNKQPENPEIDAESLPQLMKTLDIVAVATVVAPALCMGKTEQDGKIPVSRLKFDDKAAIFAWALGAEHVPAEAFPEKQNGHLEPVSKVQKIRRKTK